MIKENKAEFEICNIPKWHKQGYTGKGIKIANLESCNPNLWYLDDKVQDPFNYGSTSFKNKHANKTTDVLHQIAPDSGIYILPKGKDIIEKTLPFIKQRKINLVNASLGGINEKKLNNAILNAQDGGATFVTSAGNKGNRGLSSYAKSNVWISVGALGYRDNKGEVYLKSYSSRGKELDVSCFSGLHIHDSRKGYKSRTFQVEGTSFSSPMMCGMLALVQQFFLEKVGRTLYQDEIMKFIQDNVIDLGEEGHDELYGYGLFILPNPEDIEVEKYLLRGDKVDKQGFINSVLEGAKDGYKRYKILPSLTIAQAILESGWGKKHIENNLFGMKASASWTGKVAYRNTKEWNGSRYVTIQAAFRAYDSFNDSVMDHNKLLGELKRYAKVRQANDYKEACREVWKAGYATDPKYPEKLINIIETNNLIKYDEEVNQAKEHWAKKHYDSLNAKGITIHEQRFDDPITRGEVFALLDRLINLKGVK